MPRSGLALRPLAVGLKEMPQIRSPPSLEQTLFARTRIRYDAEVGIPGAVGARKNGRAFVISIRLALASVGCKLALFQPPNHQRNTRCSAWGVGDVPGIPAELSSAVCACPLLPGRRAFRDGANRRRQPDRAQTSSSDIEHGSRNPSQAGRCPGSARQSGGAGAAVMRCSQSGRCCIFFGRQ